VLHVDRAVDVKEDSAMFTREPLPFDLVERAFQQCGEGRDPLVIDGSAFDDLPSRLIPLTELRGLLLQPHVRYETRDAVVAGVVARARQRDDRWAVGLIGLLLPGLRRALARFVHGELSEDAQAEVLAGLVADLVHVTRTDRVAGAFIGRAVVRARRSVARALETHRYEVHREDISATARVTGTPEAVLDAAYRAGEISDRDRYLIRETRLSGLSLAAYAAHCGESVTALTKRRLRAEKRLVAWIDAGQRSSRRDPWHAESAGRGNDLRRFS
jgi:hypothetical protein